MRLHFLSVWYVLPLSNFNYYWLLMHVLSLFLDLFASLGIANSDKDLEIILRRQ